MAFNHDEWLNSWQTFFIYTVKEGNPQYIYETKELLLRLGVLPQTLDQWVDKAFHDIPAKRQSLILEGIRTYVPRERPLGKKSKDSKKKLAEFESREDEKPAVPVFGQINPLPKRRKKK